MGDMENMDVDDSSHPSRGSCKGKDDELLECDMSAYVLYHEGNMGAPCLSFDILQDNLGGNRSCQIPVTCYFISGSQAAKTHLNKIIAMKMSNLKKVEVKESDEESDDDEEENMPCITSAAVTHNGCVNRIRAANVRDTTLAASWSELGSVHIWDLTRMLEAVNDSEALNHFHNSPEPTPLFSFTGHNTEGFAVDWSPMMPGHLATGDCSKNIYVWKPQEGGTWRINSRPYTAHTKSVEDIQWSPSEQNVFASCSVDKSIRIWDARAEPNKSCMLTCENAHDQDVNVLHWNKNDPFLASGGDDSKILIWDLRKFSTKTPVAHLQYHSGPVCTLEWHPTDASVLASGSEDNKILQWELAVEKDLQAKNIEDKEDVPQQLLFIHEGQKEVKELHWHPQIPGLVLSTAHSGFNIFKTISC